MGDFDLAILGGGPGGYVAAIRASQLGQDVVLFEKERVGGLCLNWGCIPSKAILKNAEVAETVRHAADWGIGVREATYDFGAAVDRSRAVVDRIVGGVETLLKQYGVTTVPAAASLAESNGVVAHGKVYRAKNILIATGASPRHIPGVEVDGAVVLTSREALAMREAPRRAVIIGGGPVGVEFAYAWSSYGAEVHIVERLPRLLPQEDPDLGEGLRRAFSRRGIDILTGSTVEAVEVADDAAAVSVLGADGSVHLDADVVLVAAGFVPRTLGLNLEVAGVVTDEQGFIKVDDDLQTNVPGVYAAGDVTGRLMLAHVASHQGVVAVERMAGLRTPAIDYRQMPRAVFCQPQVASIGYTAEEAREAGFDATTGRFPLVALGQAIAVGETEGFVKVIADAGTRQVLGIHMLGHNANQLLGEASLALLLEATTRELGFAVAPHPTLSEALKEAALAAEGAAIHTFHRRGASSRGG